MSCQNCCAYNDQFSDKVASRDLSNFKRGKNKKSTEKLLQALCKLDVSEKSLLDIGSGIGIIPSTLFKRGLRKAILVDASQPYQEVAKHLLSEGDANSRCQFIHGDFVNCHDEVKEADIVTLDKVICCYEDFNSLVQLSVSKAKYIYAIIIPREVWWVKFFHFISLLMRKVSGNTFRSYVHPVKKIEEIIYSSGFKPLTNLFQREWMILLYENKG